VRDGTGAFAWVASYKGPAGTETFRHAAGRNNSAGEFELFLTQFQSPWALWRFNTVTATFTRLATPDAGGHFKGVALPPLQPPSATSTPPPTASRTPTPSNTPSASGTASPSATVSGGSSPSGTPSPSVTASASPLPGLSRSSFLVLRTCGGAGDPAYNATATTATDTLCSLAVEEWNLEYPTAPSRIQAIELPTAAAASADDVQPCTLFPDAAATTGALVLSRSGAAVTLFCWGAPPQVGTASDALPSATVPRVVVRITQDGVQAQEYITGASCAARWGGGGGCCVCWLGAACR
jgi:hypothetical protein